MDRVSIIERLESKRREYMNEGARYLEKLMLDVSKKLGIDVKEMVCVEDGILFMREFYRMVVEDIELKDVDRVLYRACLYICTGIDNEVIAKLIKRTEGYPDIYMDASVVLECIEPVLRVTVNIDGIDISIYAVLDRVKCTEPDIVWKE